MPEGQRDVKFLRDARQRILALDNVVEATVDLVWDPPWNPSLISDTAKQKLGIT